MPKFIDRTGEERINNQGLKMKIIKYNGTKNISVQFEDNIIVNNKEYAEFTRGSIKNNFYPSVCRKGYVGNAITKIDGVHKKSYEVWNKMLQRCYNKKYHKNSPTYKICEVCENWLCYENFEHWFNENYYEIKNEKNVLR